MPELTTGASATSSFISLIKTIMGAGLMSIPYAFSTDGLIFGVIITGIAALTSGFGLFLQVYVAKYVPAGHATFFNLCSITYPALSVAFDVAIATQCFGCAISYLVLIGDLMPSIFTNVPFLAAEHHRTFWIIASTVLCVPLSFTKNLDSLKYSSVLGMVAIGYLFCLTIVHFLIGDIPVSYKGDLILFPLSAMNVFSTFSIIVFAMTGHQNMFSIINEAADKSLSSLAYLVNLTVVASGGIFLVMGLAGYLTFGSLVNGNIILLYPPAFSTTLAKLSIVFMVVFSFPLMIHPARISVNHIYYWVLVSIFGKHPPPSDALDATSPLLAELERANMEALAPNTSKVYIVPFPDRTFYTITTVLLVVGYTAAATVKSFAFVLAVVGATGSTSISFILPGLFGYKLIGSESDDPSKLEQIMKWLGLVLTVWGVLVMVLCLYSSLVL